MKETCIPAYMTWKSMCEKNEDVLRVCIQVKELVDRSAKYVDGVLLK